MTAAMNVLLRLSYFFNFYKNNMFSFLNFSTRELRQLKTETPIVWLFEAQVSPSGAAIKLCLVN
jgi:hypothetical protein